MAVKLATFTFGGMDNLNDPVTVGAPKPNEKKLTYTQCVDILNCDVVGTSAATRREGSQLVVPGAITSSWGDGENAFCVLAGKLHTFDGANLTLMGGSPTLDDHVEFCAVNGIVVWSDNAAIGCIHTMDGLAIHTFSNPRESVDVQDLEAWVLRNYPAPLDQPERNPEIDAFKLDTLAGRCLEFFNGALYLAIDNFIYRTKTFDVEHMDMRYNVVAGFPSAVTMIGAVADGLYVGTEQETFFLPGSGLEFDETGKMIRDFEQRRISRRGVIYGSKVRTQSEAVPLLETRGDVCVWTSPLGVFAGGAGGKVFSLTDNRVAIPDATAASARIQRRGEGWQYLCCPN